MTLHQLGRRDALATRRLRAASDMARAEAMLGSARNSYEAALRARQPLREIRACFNILTKAYATAIGAAVTVEHLRRGHVTSHLSELRSLQQSHLLNAPSGVCTIATVRPSSYAALGPRIAGLAYNAPSPHDSLDGHRWGIDLTATLDRSDGYALAQG